MSVCLQQNKDTSQSSCFESIDYGLAVTAGWDQHSWLNVVIKHADGLPKGSQLHVVCLHAAILSHITVQLIHHQFPFNSGHEVTCIQLTACVYTQDQCVLLRLLSARHNKHYSVPDDWHSDLNLPVSVLSIKHVGLAAVLILFCRVSDPSSGLLTRILVCVESKTITSMLSATSEPHPFWWVWPAWLSR